MITFSVKQSPKPQHPPVVHSLSWELLMLGSFSLESLLVLHIGVILVQAIKIRLCLLSFADVSAFMEDGVKFSYVPSSHVRHCISSLPNPSF